MASLGALNKPIIAHRSDNKTGAGVVRPLHYGARPFARSTAPAQPAQQLISRRHHVAVAVGAAATDAPASPGASAASPGKQGAFQFVCPICLTQEFEVAAASPYERLACPRCSRTFEAAPRYLDLTLTSGVKQRVFQQKAWGGTELFRQPLISFVYERGWRQNFAAAGFPGPDREYEMAMRYFTPVLGGTLLDASCGTGLFSRLFARSGRFSGVVALDFSESMLEQAQDFFAQDPQLKSGTPIVCVRADIARLPFATGSLDAIHAGAAIHCWPNPQAALAEISRVLRPGGVLVGSTFMSPLAPLGEVLGDDNVRPLVQGLNPFSSRSNMYRSWEEAELKELCETVGLTGFARNRSRQFIMWSATKPGSSSVLESSMPA